LKKREVGSNHNSESQQFGTDYGHVPSLSTQFFFVIDLTVDPAVDLGLALDHLQLFAVVLWQLIFFLGEVALHMLGECCIDVIDSAALAEEFVLAEEDLLEAGVVYYLQFAGLVLDNMGTESFVEGG
jgi:hypothetical protein